MASLRSHVALHASLAPLQALPAREEALQADVIDAAAAAKTQRAHVDRARRACDAARAALSSGGLLARVGKRARQRKEALREAEAAYAAQCETLANIERRIEKLRLFDEDVKQGMRERKGLLAEIDALDEVLFERCSSSYSEVRAAESHYLTLRNAAELLRAEIPREARARGHVAGAEKAALQMVKELQAALQHGINVGVASNTKYTRQIGAGATPHVTAKGMEPRVRTAKILSGRMYERMAEARVIQPEIRPLPTLDIVELYKLPGRRRQDSLSEQDFCRSIEASYAQAKHCASHLRYGLRASNARETAAKAALRTLELEVSAARDALREHRRAVVEAAVRKGDTQLRHSQQRDDQADVDDAARARLRAILKQCNEKGREADVPPEDEDGAGWDLLMS